MTDTVIGRLAETARRAPARIAFRAKRDGSWQATSWRDYERLVRRVGRGFLACGLEPGDGVVIMSFNRPEWFVADLAAIAAGGVPAGVYTTSSAEQSLYIARHAGAAIAVLENEEMLATFLSFRERLPRLRTIVLLDGTTAVPGVLTWDDLLRRADETPAERLAERLSAQRPGDLCTLIYTSGTTGEPKAVMLSHRNLSWIADRVSEALPVTADDRVISYLPLAHIAEQIVSLHGPLAVGATTWFAESVEALPGDLRDARPTVFFAVPRVWEKMQSAIELVGAANPLWKRKIAAWARRKGLAGGYAASRGERSPAFYGLADKLVFSPVRKRLGLDCARVLISSAAPLALDTQEFFLSLGMPILEVYGMSECTGPATFSLPASHRIGKAGRAIPGTEIAIAADGEILIRGPHVFLGYLGDPAGTREALDAEGWLHSGDIGELDPEGFLAVTDRKKEILITSGGKNIGPQALEARLKTIPVVAQAVVVGDRRKYLAALLTLDPARLPAEAATAGSPARTAAEAARCAVFRAHLEHQVDLLNEKLGRHERIRRIRILSRELSEAGGELTATMKLRRRVIHHKYAAEIDELYQPAAGKR